MKYIGIFIISLAVTLSVFHIAACLNIKGGDIITDVDKIAGSYIVVYYMDDGNLRKKTIFLSKQNYTTHVNKNYGSILYNVLIPEIGRFKVNLTVFEHESYVEASVKIEELAEFEEIEIGLGFPNTKGYIFLAPGIYENEWKVMKTAKKRRVDIITSAEAPNLEDNYISIYELINRSNLFIFQKKISLATISEEKFYWSYPYFRWRFKKDDFKKHKVSFRFWIKKVKIYDEKISKKAFKELAHEALCKPVEIEHKITRGYNYYLHEVYYRFEKEENEWNIDPFKDSPHNKRLEIVNDTSVCAVYLPENAMAYGEKPAVINSTGENAIGLYFRDSINGIRSFDNWFGNRTAGGGFYVKKKALKDVVRVTYITPAEPLIESENIEIPKIVPPIKSKRGNESYSIILIDKEAMEEYTRFSKIFAVASFIVLIAALIYAVFDRIRR